MLKESDATLRSAAPHELEAAEIVAHEMLVCQLVENLIPTDEAERTIDAHRAEADETWRRQMFGALQGLRAATRRGFRLTRD